MDPLFRAWKRYVEVSARHPRYVQRELVELAEYLVRLGWRRTDLPAPLPDSIDPKGRYPLLTRTVLGAWRAGLLDKHEDNRWTLTTFGERVGGDYNALLEELFPVSLVEGLDLD